MSRRIPELLKPENALFDEKKLAETQASVETQEFGPLKLVIYPCIIVVKETNNHGDLISPSAEHIAQILSTIKNDGWDIYNIWYLPLHSQGGPNCVIIDYGPRN